MRTQSAHGQVQVRSELLEGAPDQDESNGEGEQAARLSTVNDLPARLANPYAHVLGTYYELHGEHLPLIDAHLLLEDLVTSCGRAGER